MTQLDQLFAQIGKFVLKQTDFSFTRAQTIVKQHTEKLSQTGDIGFPTTVQPWLNAIEANPNHINDFKQIITESEAEFARKLCEISSDWLFPIEMVKFKQFRCLLFLNRQKCYSGLLKTVLYDDASSYGQWHHHETNDDDANYAVQMIKQSNENSLVEHRCTIFAKVLINLLRISGFEANAAKFDGIHDLNENDNSVDVLVKSARRDGTKGAIRQCELELNNNANRKTISIICGNVTSRPDLTADDFIRLRSLEMEKTAELKHGHNKENIIIDKCQKLGAATVTFDLLKIKHFNAIDFDKLMTTTSTIKGAAFILYNFARLQTLLTSFDHQVTRGFYDSLPDFDQIDFGLLKEEEEWQLFFVYIIGFPTMLERCISGLENGQIAIHLLCTFLSNLSALFSVYYHRVKILTDNLPQLVPVLYARIYFLKALRIIFLKALAILEIEPINQM